MLNTPLAQKAASALFVQPHFDDVAMSCGATVASESAPSIVTVFSEGPEPGALLGALARSLHASWGIAGDPTHTRRREDATACAILGAVGQALGWRDAIYRGTAYQTTEALVGPPQGDDERISSELASRLVEIWQRMQRPTIYLPLAVGGHVDHRLVQAAGKRLEAAGAAVLYYEDFPYALHEPDAVEARARELGLGRPQLVDVTSTLAKRVDAIVAYASQLTVLFGRDDARKAVRRYAAALASAPGRYAERFWST